MKLMFCSLFAALVLVITACDVLRDDTNADSEAPSVPTETATEPDASKTSAATENTITLTMDNQTFFITLQDSETARQFAARLPLSLDMNELNGNEKYCYLESELPTDASQPGEIHTGDLMLYGNNCLVLFYESFSSGYSYTRLGHVDNPAGLAEALGTGAVTVEFFAGK